MRSQPTVSLVVCACDVDRELPRTIHTLSSDYQQEVSDDDYEIVVVDNGSRQPVSEDELRKIAGNVRLIRFDQALRSPAQAMNRAAAHCGGQLLGIFIDGARMASPGMVSGALSAYRCDPTKVIGSLGFDLGPDIQMRSVANVYNQAAEDDLLASIPWQDDGYALFSKSVLAGSSSQGWFGNLAESNGVFLDRALWNRLQGFDERFASPGGGLVNMDFWKRAVEASDHVPWILLGEGTFHKVHGGATTRGKRARRLKMQAEYTAITGAPFSRPKYTPRFIGALDRDLAERFSGQRVPLPRQAHSVRGRAFQVGLPTEVLERIQAGTLRTRYRGRRFAKNPFDLVLYLRLIEKLRPATIIEIGTSEGGSAEWFRDQCNMLGLSCDILTIDIKLPNDPVEGVSMFQADANRPGETFPHAEIAASAHPWLVVEDSAHMYSSTMAVLEYFDRLMRSGDRIVVEDGVVADLPGEHYRKYADGPNHAVKEFLDARAEQYEIDTDLCDFFGHNVTYCPNAWLVRR